MPENKKNKTEETVVNMNQEKLVPEPKTPQQKLILWGIPTAIVLILIILLAFEVVEEEEISNDALVSDEQTVSMLERENIEKSPSSDDQTGTPNEKKGVVQQKFIGGQATGFKAGKTDEVKLINIAPEEDTKDIPLIIEEDNFRWKIATGEDSIEDEWKWKTILVQNRAKINYTIFSDETNQWRINIDSGQRLLYSPSEEKKSAMSFDRSRKKRFALQLISMDTNRFKTAIETVRFLVKGGYFAYVYRTEDKIRTSASNKPQYFYRVRVGFFERESEALAAGREIFELYQSKRIFPPDYWAVLPSFRELNGELIDFGIQRSKPWIIQLTKDDDRNLALQNLNSITSIADFSYVSQKKQPNGKMSYRTRVGFFETENEAQKILSKIQSGNPGAFRKASLVKLKRITEAAPGQNTASIPATTIN